jgi:flagellar hook-associated protein 2
MAPLINFSGIASGIDSSSLIKALLERERATRIKPLEDKIATYQDSNTAFSKLKSLLSTLSSAADKFRALRGGAVAKSASTSDETVASASASNAASPGAYTVSVSQLAKNATLSISSSAGTYASSSAALSSGSSFTDNVTVTIGNPSSPTDTVSVAVDETTTLSGFVAEFNSQTTSATASVVNVGTSSSPDYKIVINTAKTGTEQGAIDIAVGTTLSGRGAFDTTSRDDADDAQFSISGISGSITRSSNSISDVIPGLTLSLKGTGTSIINIGVNSSQTASNVQDFVDAYNEVISFISENDLVSQEGEGNNKTNVFGALAGSSLDENLITALRGAFSGASGSGELVNTLADLGVTTERDGTLAFNTTTFTSALASDPLSSSALLERLGESLAKVDGTIAQFTRFGGLIDDATRANSDQISDSEDRIAILEQSLAKQEESLTQRFSRLEALIGKLNSQQSQLSSLLPR